ncbi:hypothetical protein [Streptomyces halstedii]|uniref:hypothetical protein n=1 Tax=Streptomyces halstedii TaxID=1944 RepID=UPI003418B331
MSDFKQFLQYRALDLKFSLQGTDLADAVIESGADIPIPLRNVCAKLTVELAERIDRTAETLGITKRQFIERALIDAMDQADAMIREVGVFDDLAAQHQAAEASE